MGRVDMMRYGACQSPDHASDRCYVSCSLLIAVLWLPLVVFCVAANGVWLLQRQWGGSQGCPPLPRCGGSFPFSPTPPPLCLPTVRLLSVRVVTTVHGAGGRCGWPCRPLAAGGGRPASPPPPPLPRPWPPLPPFGQPRRARRSAARRPRAATTAAAAAAAAVGWRRPPPPPSPRRRRRRVAAPPHPRSRRCRAASGVCA